MATKTFYFKDATASGSSHGSLQDGGTAPTAATSNTIWTVAKNASGNFALQNYAATVASGSFSTTDSLNTQTNAGTNNSWRTENTLNGVFASGNWTITGVFRTGTASTHVGRLNVRVFTSPNANGTANVTIHEETTSKLTFSNTAAMGSTTTDYTSSVTWAAPLISLYNEYLFITCQWETTVAGGANGADVRWRVGSTANTVTTNFTSRRKFASTT